MKKRISFLLLFVLLIIVAGYMIAEYKHSRERDRLFNSPSRKTSCPVYFDDNETVQIWNGKSLEGIYPTMASMLWLRPTFTGDTKHRFPEYYQIYKRFDDDDYAVLWDCFLHPDTIRYPEENRGYNLPFVLYLSFLDGHCYIIRFDLENRDETAVFPHGCSKKVYTLFMDKPESPAYDPKKDPHRKAEDPPMMGRPEKPKVPQ